MALHVLGGFSATELYSPSLLNVSDRVLPGCPGSLKAFCPFASTSEMAGVLGVCQHVQLAAHLWGPGGVGQAALTHLACGSFCSTPGSQREWEGKLVSFRGTALPSGPWCSMWPSADPG